MSFVDISGLNDERTSYKQAKLVIVLDNTRAHASEEVTRLAGQLNMELMFLPPYCPELNSIESLWS